MTTREERLAALAALAEPLRRRLYLHVVEADKPVGRDEAASALGIARPTAAFHLDKLAEVGLLAVEFRRPPGRSGPGAGRPAKLYRPVDAEVDFSVPERHYEVAASLLAQAMEDARVQDVKPDVALRSVARDYGRAVGAELRGDSADADHIEQVATALGIQGYEPHREGSLLTLVNCPFRALAQEHRDLVCSMNYEVLAGMLEGLGVDGVVARLDPAAGRCCVTMAAS